MKQGSIKFEFEARYFQFGEITDETKKLIFVLHGYGQQAKYFIKKFSILNTNENCVIAPEGLSRFYLEGFSGRVGATWMTKEDRLADIQNYISYLNVLYKKVIQEKNNIEVSIIGFSQGAATASRWAADEQVSFDQLILWAGIFPPDMDMETARHQFKDKSISYVYGTDDPFLSEEKLNEMTALAGKLSVKPAVYSFKGGHDIDKETLKKIFQ